MTASVGVAEPGRGQRETSPEEPCLELEDQHGFTCDDYIEAGYTCAEVAAAARARQPRGC